MHTMRTMRTVWEERGLLRCGHGWRRGEGGGEGALGGLVALKVEERPKWKRFPLGQSVRWYSCNSNSGEHGGLLKIYRVYFGSCQEQVSRTNYKVGAGSCFC